MDRPEQLPEAGESGAGPARMLVVDDSAVNRLLATATLQAAGEGEAPVRGYD